MSDRYGSIPISSGAPDPDSQKQVNPAPQKAIPPKKERAGFSKLWLFAAIAIVCTGVYFLAATYLAPLAIKKYLPRYIQDKTGLSLSIEAVHLNPINFQINMESITADIPNSTAPPLLQIQSMFVDLDLTALIRNTFVCEKLTLDNLQLKLVRHKDKSYNIPALSRFSTTQNQDEIIEFSKLPFLFSLNNIDINNSRISLTDNITNKTHTIEKLQLAIPTLSNFSFKSKNYIQPHFSAIINGSPIQLSGEAVQLAEKQGFETKLSCSIGNLDLIPYFSYLPSTFPFILSKGRADTSLQIAFSPNKKEGGRLRIDIKMAISDVKIKKKNSALQVSVPTVQVDALLMPVSKQLHFKTILIKEPHLTGSQEQIRNVLKDLLFRMQQKGGSHGIFEIEQLLSEHGRVTISSDDKSETKPLKWQKLQLSIKNFHSHKNTGVIRLSGEQAQNKGSFSWQGHFLETGAVQGKLLLKDAQAATLFKQLSPKIAYESIQGVATFTGDIIFPVSTDSTFSYDVTNGIAELHNLSIFHKKKAWLQAGSVRFTRLNKEDDRSDLGNIFIKNASLALTGNDLPPLFKQLFTDTDRPQIKEIDFSGTLHLKADTNQQEALEISKITFQANHLDQVNSENNFIFSGQLGKNGTIKAKGTLSFAPVSLQTGVAFTKVDFHLLSPFFSRWPLLKNSSAILHGKGIFHFPEQSFQGGLQLTNTTLQSSDKTPFFKWERGDFRKINCILSPFSLEAETLTLDTPQFQWQREPLSAFQHLQQGLRTLFQNPTEKDLLFPVTIKRVTVRNGSVHLLDKRLSPAWETDLENLEGHINNFNTNADGPSSFALKGVVVGAAFTVSGTTALFSDVSDTRARIQLTNFPLATLEKQLQSIPVKTTAATLDLNTNLTENQSTFSSKTEMLIKNLKPRSIISDTALALAFLKNEEEIFPMSIVIDDGSQPLLKEGLASFQTTLIKASYAPLLLDRKFKDLQDKDLIVFLAGSNKIDRTGRQTLARYASLLENHPGLGLVLTGMADAKSDREVLQKQLETAEQQRVDAENTKNRAEYRQKQQAIRAIQPGQALQEEDIAQKDLAGFKPLLPKQVQVSDKELLRLAKERSLLVYDACIHSLGISPKRVVIAGKNIISMNPLSNGVRITIKAIATDPR